MTGQTAIDCHPSVMKHHSKLQRLSVGGNEADCVASCAVVATVVVVAAAAAAAAADFHFPKLNRERKRERERGREKDGFTEYNGCESFRRIETVWVGSGPPRCARKS